MGVELTADGLIAVVSDGTRHFPTAEELYAVCFEGASTCCGQSVAKHELNSLAVTFRRHVADLILAIECEHGERGPQVITRLLARHGGLEAEVRKAGGRCVDYVVIAGQWSPLSRAAIDEYYAIEADVGAELSGALTVRHYLALVAHPTEALSISDRTSKALVASSIAGRGPAALPASFVGSLYPYQEDGYRWLSFMARAGIGGLIADEMGLGKTVQVICLLLESCQRGERPSLVLCPATLLENWRRELERFAPTMGCVVHSGPRRTGLRSELAEPDVVLASYETAVADMALFKAISWNILVVDEAQNIRNPIARRTLQIKQLNRRCSIAVTGTPIENQLRDIWAITDFLVPLLLGTQAEFEDRYPNDLEGATRLEPLISPLVLRRRVADVANDLPTRIDIPQAITLDSCTVGEYEAIREAARDSVESGAGLAALTKLRQFCTHPWLVMPRSSQGDPTECSAKLRRLLEILAEVFESRGKALVFTSYTGAIDLLVDVLGGQLGVPADAIDGRTPMRDRQVKVDLFQREPGAAVLVLNPRAAGTGLNITAANHVIHFNPEWNPAVEDQASARAHRRGQVRPVTIHRLYYSRTIEDVMCERMVRKREVAGAAVVGTSGQAQDINDLLRAIRVSPAGRPLPS